MSLRLGVNIDHVATLRQARYREMPDAPQVEPSPLEAALEAEAAGAHSITAHLRADRRHIVDADIQRLRAEIATPLNLEMGCTEEMIGIALRVRPASACLVPEHRQEVTTEGGLAVASQKGTLGPCIERLQAAGTRVSLFIDPDLEQVRAAAELGAAMIELHTGAFANAFGAERTAEIARLVEAAQLGQQLGLQVNAGHGLTCRNLPELFAVPHLQELNIGHSIVSRAVFVGLRAAVAEMLAVMVHYPHVSHPGNRH